MTEAQNTLANLKADLVKAQNDLRHATELKAAREAELEESRAKVDELEGSLQSTSSELARVREEASTLERALETTSKDLERVTRAHGELESTNLGLTTSLEELRTSVATLNDTQSSHSERAAALAVSLEQKDAAARAAHEAGEKMRKELQGLRDEVAEAEKGRTSNKPGRASRSSSSGRRNSSVISTRCEQRPRR
jgi:chromosome segregation ATPase